MKPLLVIGLSACLLAACDSAELQTSPPVTASTIPIEPPEPIGVCDIVGNIGGQDASPEFGSAMAALRDHIDGSATLTEQEIDNVSTWMDSVSIQMKNSASLIQQAFDTLALYDQTYGPLFVNANTQNGISRTATGDDVAIHFAIIKLHQAVMDYAYADGNVLRFRDVLKGKSFSTADYFPGALPTHTVTAPYTVKINASNPETNHRPFGAMTGNSRRPTGAYAPPGSIVEINVPYSLVGKGFMVRVGAHSWDLSAKPKITRLDRVSLTYAIDCTNMVVSNPLGGGIYIEVPYGADAGAVDIQIINATRSPFYGARSFTEHTTPEEWAVEKTHTAPWADIEGDHFMVQVPTPWLDEIEDPVKLMADWNAAMESILALFGVTETHKTMLYAQVDTTLRGNAFYPGYPMSNNPYSPSDPSNKTSGAAYLQGPDKMNYVAFHELGHQLYFTKFRGETEAVVHLPYVNFMNTVFGVDLDTAFTTSTFRNANVTMDESFINWAVRPNFQDGLPMRWQRPNSEMAYQRRGFTKYVTIAKLFGWDALEAFWASVHEDYLNGIDYNRNNTGAGDTDSRILRMSRAANIDLRPLLHVWGIHPEDPDALADAIAAEGLLASTAIYDEMERYKSLIPMTNAAFEEHARKMYPFLRENANTVAFEGWYHEKAKTYSSNDGYASLQALQNIIDLYFPGGRPIIVNDQPVTTRTGQIATEAEVTQFIEHDEQDASDVSGGFIHHTIH